MKRKIGTPAPSFEAPAYGTGYKVGDTIKLEELRGQKVVLVFYPKDSTPG